jgi:hypothetical protein
MTPGYDFVLVPGPDGTYEMRPIPRDMDALERKARAEMGLILLSAGGIVIFCGVLAVTWLLMSLIL